MDRPERRRALFLDRDGFLNDLVHYPDSGEWESPRRPADLRLVPGALEALRELQAGRLLFVVSNQPSYAKGKVTLEDLQAVGTAFEARCREAGVILQEAFYCYHHPQGVVEGFSGPCPCRKPAPHSLLQAAERFGLDLAHSWMAGDQDMDILCGRNAGCRTLLLPCAASAHKRGAQIPDLLAASWAEIPALLLAYEKEHP